MGFFQLIGGLVISFLQYLSEVSMLLGEIAGSLVRGKIRGRMVKQQIVEIGYRSQPVVMVTGLSPGRCWRPSPCSSSPL